MSEIKEEVINLLAEHLSYDKSKIQLKSNIIDDLGADSLDAVEIVMALEEKYGISILDSEAENIKTVEQLIKIVEEKKNG
jgi:acyl carrier protein